MSRCPELKVDCAPFSYEYYCRKLGIKIGDDCDKTKVQYVCDCDNYYNCPVYRK